MYSFFFFFKQKSDISGPVPGQLAMFVRILGEEAREEEEEEEQGGEPITWAAPDTDTNVAPEASITLCRPFFPRLKRR